jgi:hypothetical protein
MGEKRGVHPATWHAACASASLRRHLSHEHDALHGAAIGFQQVNPVVSLLEFRLRADLCAGEPPPAIREPKHCLRVLPYHLRRFLCVAHRLRSTISSDRKRSMVFQLETISSHHRRAGRACSVGSRPPGNARTPLRLSSHSHMGSPSSSSHQSSSGSSSYPDRSSSL